MTTTPRGVPSQLIPKLQASQAAAAIASATAAAAFIHLHPIMTTAAFLADTPGGCASQQTAMESALELISDLGCTDPVQKTVIMLMERVRALEDAHQVALAAAAAAAAEAAARYKKYDESCLRQEATESVVATMSLHHTVIARSGVTLDELRDRIAEAINRLALRWRGKLPFSFLAVARDPNAHELYSETQQIIDVRFDNQQSAQGAAAWLELLSTLQRSVGTVSYCWPSDCHGDYLLETTNLQDTWRLVMQQGGSCTWTYMGDA